MFELSDVSYSYDGRPALRSVHLKIAKGEAIAFLGANGCGKSTLLKLLSGLIFPLTGSFRYNGEAINRQKMDDTKYAKQFHQQIGFVFQNPDTQLFCADVFAEIAFGPRQMGLAEQDVAQRVGDMLELLDLRGFERRQPYHLSGGEKRKVALAAVLAMNPDALILDEPMNGLDPRSMRWLAEFLVQLNKNGKTLILSTHNLDLVQEISPRAVLFAEDHTIAADLQTDNLLGDLELLKRVNLVDPYYHQHSDSGHTSFHIHSY
ncbi:MAG: energy-coupling factor ABC transporter ATP-binding protein [Peptococcaceae bacterium]|jgi:cobalt/nickel transport system ATP-binding protein|nr:energy-coupling factor ABC transporter ATP-binding protein [Peptococcaceae bacterium]